MSNSFAIPWTVALQAPLSMGFLRQEYWSGWPFPSAGDLPNPEIEPRSPTLQAYSLPAEHSQVRRVFFSTVHVYENTCDSEVKMKNTCLCDQILL